MTSSPASRGVERLLHAEHVLVAAPREVHEHHGVARHRRSRAGRRTRSRARTRAPAGCPLPCPAAGTRRAPRRLQSTHTRRVPSRGAMRVQDRRRRSPVRPRSNGSVRCCRADPAARSCACPAGCRSCRRQIAPRAGPARSRARRLRRQSAGRSGRPGTRRRCPWRCCRRRRTRRSCRAAGRSPRGTAREPRGRSPTGIRAPSADRDAVRAPTRAGSSCRSRW